MTDAALPFAPGRFLPPTTLVRPSASIPTQFERSDPVGMPRNRCQVRRASSKAFLRAAPIVNIHTGLRGKLESSCLSNRRRAAQREPCRLQGKLRLGSIVEQTTADAVAASYGDPGMPDAGSPSQRRRLSPRVATSIH
jgi:hypothetical protein